jgi:hypothetical protein
VTVEIRPPARPCAGSLSSTRQARRPPFISPANPQSGNWQLGPRVQARRAMRSVARQSGTSSAWSPARLAKRHAPSVYLAGDGGRMVTFAAMMVVGRLATAGGER